MMKRSAIKALLLAALLSMLAACASTPATTTTDTSPKVDDVSRTQSSESEKEGEDTAASTDVTVHNVEDLSSLNNTIIYDASVERSGTTDGVQAGESTENTRRPQRRANISEQAQGKAPVVRSRDDEGVNHGNAASQALLASSEKMLKQGQYKLAANDAERALRVSPRNPQAYYQLAVIYQQQNNHHQAIHFADKGLAQKGVSGSLQRKLWALKASCYTALGDVEAAAHAKTKASG